MTATALEPLHKTIEVDCSVEQAFRTFTDDIGTWWPIGAGHSIAPDRIETVAFEDGELVERYTDGTKSEWAKVTVWEPPHRIVLSWHPGRPESDATEVEFRFSDAGGRTLVELTHRYFERRGEKGAEARESYDTGWDFVLSRYAYATSGASNR